MYRWKNWWTWSVSILLVFIVMSKDGRIGDQIGVHICISTGGYSLNTIKCPTSTNFQSHSPFHRSCVPVSSCRFTTFRGIWRPFIGRSCKMRRLTSSRGASRRTTRDTFCTRFYSDGPILLYKFWSSVFVGESLLVARPNNCTSAFDARSSLYRRPRAQAMLTGLLLEQFNVKRLLRTVTLLEGLISDTKTTI